MMSRPATGSTIMQAHHMSPVTFSPGRAPTHSARCSRKARLTTWRSDSASCHHSRAHYGCTGSDRVDIDMAQQNASANAGRPSRLHSHATGPAWLRLSFADRHGHPGMKCNVCLTENATVHLTQIE